MLASPVRSMAHYDFVVLGGGIAGLYEVTVGH